MKVTHALPLAALALALLGSSGFAQTAPVVFGLTQTYLPTQFTAGNGVGQAVTVADDMTIDGFGFYLEQRGGGDVDFFILNQTTGQTIVDPTGVSTVASPKQWDNLDFNTPLALTGGDTYIFGVYGDNLMTVGTQPQATFTSDGLGVGASYDFTGTTNTGSAANEVGLRIYSNDPPDAPEPSSLLLLGTGIMAAAGVVRKRLTS